MGSFNVACGISGVPLREGDRVGLQVLAQGFRGLQRRSDAVCTDSTREFRLASLPIYGTYNEYGSLVDVEDTAGLHLLEHLLNRPMSDDLLSAITEGDNIYYRPGSFMKLYLNPEQKLTNCRVSAHDKLISLGFVHKAVSESSGEYSFGRAKIITKIVDGSLFSEEIQWQRGVKPYAVSIEYLIGSLLEHFSELTGEWPGVADEDVEAVRLLSTMTAMFFAPSVKDAVAEVVRAEGLVRTSFDRFTKNWADAQLALTSSSESETKALSVMTMLSDNMAVEDMSRRMSDREIIYSMKQVEAEDAYWFVEFPLVMEEIGRFFAPSAYLSTRFGGSEAFKAIRPVTDNILAQHRVRFEEDEDDLE